MADRRLERIEAFPNRAIVLLLARLGLRAGDERCAVAASKTG
jgi:hypothetical protein